MSARLRIFESVHAYEVIDVDLAHVFYADTAADAKDLEVVIQRQGHRVLVKERRQGGHR